MATKSGVPTSEQFPFTQTFPTSTTAAPVRDSDLFLGVIRPFYGSGKIGSRSITHEECLEAVNRRKPRWFLVHRDVTFARQLLKPYVYKKDGTRTRFRLKKTPVLDDLRVLDLYNDVILNDTPVQDRRGHWAQEFFRVEDALQYVEAQFRDLEHVRRICEDMRVR